MSVPGVHVPPNENVCGNAAMYGVKTFILKNSFITRLNNKIRGPNGNEHYGEQAHLNVTRMLQ